MGKKPKKQKQNQPKKRRGPKAALEGSGLYLRTDSSRYWWRGVDQSTGKLIRQSTGCANLVDALLKAKKIKEELKQAADGLPSFKPFRASLKPLIRDFLDELEVSAQTKERLRKNLDRASLELGLSCLGDLHRLDLIKRKVKELQDTGAHSAATLRKYFQQPLKRLSHWLYEEAILASDVLDRWRNLRVPASPGAPRRALLPSEVVRALHAADAMQGVSGGRSPHSLRPVLLALIIAAPRISALAQLNVADLDLEGARLVFGEGAGNKGAGAGHLDNRTCIELRKYVGDRTSGPLFLSPGGGRLDKANMLKDWRAIFSLALVDELWPGSEDRDFRTAYLVHLSLSKGETVYVLGGGRKPGPGKQAARQRRKEHIEYLVDLIRPAWENRMIGVDLHCFRKTARTWCIQEQVPEVFIDLQLGHVSQRGKDALSAFWSWTGQRHYTDFELLAGNASRVAVAVRKRLDEAEAEFQDQAAGNSCLKNTFSDTVAVSRGARKTAD